MSNNMKAMIRRKQLVSMGGDEAELLAKKIVGEVRETGGLTTDEIYGQMAY